MSKIMRKEKFIYILQLVFLLLVILISPNIGNSQSSVIDTDNQEVFLDSLKRAYDRAPERIEAMRRLSSLIDSGQIQYNPDILDKYILYMLDYYDREGDLKSFSESIYKIIDYDYIRLINSHFRNTDRLGKVVDELIQKWKTPASINILESGKLIQLERNDNKGKPLNIYVKNDIGKVLSEADFTLVANPKPKDAVSFSNGKIKSGKECCTGTLEIYIKSKTKISASVDYEIYGCQDTTVTPIPDPVIITGVNPPCGFPGTQVEIEGENFNALAESNMIKFGNVEVDSIFIEAGILYTKVPENAIIGKLPVTLTTPVDTAIWSKRFQVKELPTKPSMKWPLIASGVFALSGLDFIRIRIKALNKWDEYLDNNKDLNLYNEYTKINRPTTLTGELTIVTFASGLATGYLWYKYYKSHKEYKNKLNEPCITTEIIWDDDYIGLAASYNF